MIIRSLSFLTSQISILDALNEAPALFLKSMSSEHCCPVLVCGAASREQQRLNLMDERTNDWLPDSIHLIKPETPNLG